LVMSTWATTTIFVTATVAILEALSTTTDTALRDKALRRNDVTPTTSSSTHVSPFEGNHRWRYMQDCTEEEIKANTPSMISRGWWRPHMTWLLQAPPPTDDCLYAKVYKRGLAPWWLPAWAFVKADDLSSMVEGTLVEPYVPKGVRHWGIVYHYPSDVMVTDVCLNVCDVRDDVSMKVYQGRLTFMTLADPWPMDMCMWRVPLSELDEDGHMEPLTDVDYECKRMWEAQKRVWEAWEPKTYSAGNQCQHVIQKTLSEYQALSESD